jgi:ADP-ribose pyrophosphatase YjhB (NUDIX family)
MDGPLQPFVSGADGMTQSAGVTLDQLLSNHALLSEEGCLWNLWGSTSRFLVRAYACQEMPPDSLIASVRCIVTRPGEILTLGRGEDVNDTHIVPGGRREPGETLVETLCRELLEETGWAVGPPRLLGFVVYEHIDSRPSGHPFPYPTFVQLIYTAEATRHEPAAHQPDEADGDARFIPVWQAWELPLPRFQAAFLALAVGEAGNL